jgi:hypothetical protein
MKLFSFLSNTVKISAERNIYVLLNETLKHFLKLPLLHKLFLLMLILVFIYLVNRRPLIYENYDDMTSNKRFDSKFDDAVYDAFYAKYYDKIYGNKVTSGQIFSLLWIFGVLLTRPMRMIPLMFVTFFDCYTSIKRVENYWNQESCRISGITPK